MKGFIITTFIFISLAMFSQEVDLAKKAQEITEEGKYLYRLEMASWYGTDIFLENFKDRDRVGGYFSYIDKGTPKCLFFSKEDIPKVIGVVSFGNIKLIETATIDFKERNFKDSEKELYTMRGMALTQIQQDTLFKSYTNSNLNLIPVIYMGKRNVYVLTGPKKEGVVLFGNDYLLTFDDHNNLLIKKNIHQNLIPVEFNPKIEDENKIAVASMHSHSPETGDFITSTDICTLMLYAPFARWKQHIVISENYVSIWDCVNESLIIMTKEEFDRMKDEEKYG